MMVFDTIKGCPYCKFNKINIIYGMTISKFLKVSKKKFGKRFKYINLKIYKDVHISKQNIKVYCNSCNLYFNTNIKNHLITNQNGGCLSCGKKQNKRNVTHTLDFFIKRSKEKYGDRFVYDKVVYKNINTYITLFCNICNVYFKTTPYKHLNNAAGGCNGCYLRDINNKSIKIKIQNRFKKEVDKRRKLGLLDVSKAKYKGYLVPVILRCKKCSKVFSVGGQYFLKGLGNCPICDTNGGPYSKMANDVLAIISKKSKLIIQRYEYKGEYLIPNTRFRVDGYNKRFNIIIEVYGDIFHGNPKIFKPRQKCNPYSILTAGKLYKQTKDRENKLKELGYNIITVWENDWRKNKRRIIYRTLNRIKKIKREYYEINNRG